MLTAREYIQFATSIVHAGATNLNGIPLLPASTVLDLIKNFVEGSASYSIEGNTIQFKVDAESAEVHKEPKLALVRSLPLPELPEPPTPE
jgi:hypothetical protein